MSMLARKLRRDLSHMKVQAVAIALVVACGVATFVMSLCTLQSLRLTQAEYYDRYRFADVFAHVKRAPRSLGATIGEIPGVRLAQTRLVFDVNMDVPGMAEPAVGRLISAPGGAAEGLNILHLRRGRPVDAAGRAEVVASEAFARAHSLEPGATVRAVINGRRQALTIVGIALSPEYIYQVREGEPLPDDARFGVFWMDEKELAAAFGMEGAFNDVAVAIAPGASEPEVIGRLDHLLDPYGALGAIGRHDQTSHRFVSGEIDQLRAMAMVAPSIFLAVAAFLLNMVVTRLIGTQREQIAVLKAFGYRGVDIGAHYAGMVLVIVLAGVLIGTAFGAWLGHGLTEMYTRFFHFPVFRFRMPPLTVATAAGVSTASAMLGTVAAIRRAATLPPAEAMRPEAPAAYRPLWIDRVGLRGLLGPGSRMIVRQLERRSGRAAMSCAGMALGVAVMILGGFSKDAIDFLMDLQFRRLQPADLTVSFVEPAERGALEEVAHLPGVLRAEPVRAVAARVRYGHVMRRLGIVGLERGSTLRRLIDTAGRPVEIPEQGLVISDTLADILGVREGDSVRVEVLEGPRPALDVRVAMVVTDYAGLSATMNLGGVNRMMGEQDAISGVLLATDRGDDGALYSRLKELPRVSGVMSREATLRSFRRTIAENLLRMRTFNIMFACIIAFGVVYNNARITLAERGWELATLRVIGLTRAEVAFILLGELAVITAVAVPLGLILGHGMAAWAVWALQTETQRFPLVVGLGTYALAASVTLGAALASGLAVRHELDRFSLVEVLKSRG